MQNSPDINFGRTTDLLSGFNPGTGELQTLVGDFPIASLPPDIDIIHAELAMHIHEAPNGMPDNLRAYALTQDWREGSITFGSGQNMWGQDYGSGEQQNQHPGWVAFDVTELVRAWTDGSAPDLGIGIRPTDASNRTQFVVFDAHEVAYLGPRLRVHYAIQKPPCLYLPIVMQP